MNIVTNKNNSKEFILINILTNKISLLDNNETKETILISISGVDLLGNRKIIGVYNLKEDSSRNYLDLMEEVKGLGISNIYFVACEFNDKLRKAIKISYPNAICINNFTSTVLNLWKFTPIKGRNNLKKIISNLYTCESFDEANINLENLRDSFNNNKLLALLYNKYFSDIKNYYIYNKSLREFLFSDSFFISISDKIRLLNQSNNNVSYNEFIDLIRPYMIEIENTKHYNCNRWIEIIDGVAIIFPDILEKVGNLI